MPNESVLCTEDFDVFLSKELRDQIGKCSVWPMINRDVRLKAVLVDGERLLPPDVAEMRAIYLEVHHLTA
jgi:hypothetical protein